MCESTRDVMSLCTIPRRGHYVNAKQGNTVDVVDFPKKKNTNRYSYTGPSERKPDEVDSTSVSSEQKKHKLSKKPWLLRSWKNYTIIKKKDKNHTKTPTENMYELHNEQCINASDKIDEMKNDKNNREMALEKRSYVLDELVKTERDYVRDLSLVVDDYIEVIRNPGAAGCDILIPENLKTIEAQRIIFCNIEQIYEWHKNVFLKELENCSAQPLKISNIFKKNESKFYIYTVYSQKNKIFDCFMNEYRSFFEEMRKFSCHMYPLRDLLIRPVKRIMTYTLLLRKMLMFSIQANLKDQLEDIQLAIDVMCRLTKNIDEMMVVDRLRGFDGNITAQGKLLMHGSMRCAVNSGSGNRCKDIYKDFHVFLFEHTMIFAAEDDKKKKSTISNYIYKMQITVNNMIMKECYDSSNNHASNDSFNDLFLVESIDPISPKTSIVCRVPCAESRNEWLKNLKGLLQAKRDFQAALQMPIKSVQNTKKMPQSSRIIMSYRQ